MLTESEKRAILGAVEEIKLHGFGQIVIKCEEKRVVMIEGTKKTKI